MLGSHCRLYIHDLPRLPYLGIFLYFGYNFPEHIRLQIRSYENTTSTRPKHDKIRVLHKYLRPSTYYRISWTRQLRHLYDLFTTNAIYIRPVHDVLATKKTLQDCTRPWINFLASMKTWSCNAVSVVHVMCIFQHGKTETTVSCCGCR